MPISQKSSFWIRASAAITIVTLGIVIYMFFGEFEGYDGSPKVEALKLLLQFGLLTAGGGLLLAYLNKRRDDDVRITEDQRRTREVQLAGQTAHREWLAVRRTVLQELIIELGDAHRRLKVIKRQMRAQLRREVGEPIENNVAAPSFSLRADAFERAMDGLLNAQIAAEEVRDRVGVRGDLLDKSRLDRVRKALRYGARYFHDVYQDYERCLVERNGDLYTISTVCQNLTNFLIAKSLPAQLDRVHLDELERQFRVMRNDDRTLEQRHAALDRIETLREQDPQRRRYRVVATECFSLAADEMRDALVQEPEPSRCPGPTTA